MRLSFLFLFVLINGTLLAQTLGGFTLYDRLITANHPDNCDPEFVTGFPNDSTWVNFDEFDVMTGSFEFSWSDGIGPDLLLETSFHSDNYLVRLLLSTGAYSAQHSVSTYDWTNLTNVNWSYAFTTCNTNDVSDERLILPLDFSSDFLLSQSDLVTGIEITFLETVGATDLAGVYIIGEAVVPVELLFFTAEVLGEKQIKLEWQTASETNNNYFIVERSKDAINWEKLTRIDGAGYSSTLSSYLRIDNHPFRNKSYYRLKQVDYDGRFEYSKVIAAELTLDENGMNISQNQTLDEVYIDLSSLKQDELQIFSSNGQNVTGLTKRSLKNEKTLILEISKLSSGIYFVMTDRAVAKVYKR